MSNIHYFQRYSQKENIVTNNTMLLFSRLYHYDTTRFNRFLQTLLQDSGENFDAAIQFRQQKRVKHSIPDAVIEQPSIKIIIETKLYGQENLKQLKNHCKSFKNEDLQILLLIGHEPIDDSYRRNVVQLLNDINSNREKKISFAAITFKDICKNFNEVLNDFDQEMHAIIADYESFCLEEKLIDNSQTKMRAVSVGDTLQQNLQYNLYYAPTSRGYQTHKYLGLYHRKSIRAIGKITAIADISYQHEQLIVENIVLGNLTEKQKNDVKHVIIEAKEKYGYFISEGHRFFFVDHFFESNYRKTSKYGLISSKYFDLADIQGYSKSMDAKDIATFLQDQVWE